MSQENVEIVVGMVEAWKAGDRESARAAYDPNVVMILPVIDSPVLHGLDEMERGLERWRRSWKSWTLEIDDAFDAGDHVVVIARQQGIGKDTGAEVELPTHLVYSLRNSKIIRGEHFERRADALEAAGLKC